MENQNDPYQSPVAAGQTPPMMPPTQSGIPKVFGIIHIVYAAIGGIMALIGLGGGAIIKASTEPLKAEAAKNGQDITALSNSLDSIVTTSMIQSGFSVIFAIILLIAGIQLVRYKASGRMLSNLWAISRIIVAIPVTLMAVNAQGKFQEEIEKLSGAEQGLNIGAVMGGAGIVGIILISIYPVLSLIFLNKPDAKAALN